MRLIQDLANLRSASAERSRRSGLGGVLVPTMGALHEGHASLIRAGVALARERDWPEGCAVSIFVNPTQFNDPADCARYPRTLEADVDLCRHAGASTVFAPDAASMYPPGVDVPVPSLPRSATAPGLEDAHRPGHFAGVCQVVLRLFRLLEPAAAVFGEKDWQQLRVITEMVQHLRLGVQIIPGPTLRSSQGLALSSRNVFLSSDDYRRAVSIGAALARARSVRDPAEAEAVMRQEMAIAGVTVEYATVRDASTLDPITGPWAPGHPPARALVAARVGAVRLIDNSAWP